MTQRVHAIGRFYHTILTNPKQFIWISDAQLTDVFLRFTRQCKRQSSSVPGPLEARRRSSKRKNTNLACLEASNSSVDPAILLNSSSRNGWWQNSSSQTHAESSNLQFAPFWRLKPTEDPGLSYYDDSLLGSADGHLDQAHQVSHQKLREELRRTQTIGDIEKLLLKSNLNLQRTPHLSSVIFDYLLVARWEEKELGEYICNPHLNPSGSGNIDRLLHHVQQHPISADNWRLLYNSLRTATELGLVGSSEFEHIIVSLPSIRIKEDEPGILRDRNTVHDESLGLLAAMDSSRVLQLQDLQEDFLRNWLSTLSKGDITPAGVQLIWQLRHFENDSVNEFFPRLIIDWAMPPTCKELNPRSFANLLLGIPPEDLRRILLLTTEQLALSARTDDIIKNVLQFWQDTLGSLNDQGILNVCFTASDFDLTNTGNFDQLNAGQRLLIHAWTVYSTCHTQIASKHLMSKLGLRLKFESVFGQSREYPTADLLGRIVLTLQNLPLPSKGQFLQNLRYLTDDRLVIYTDYDTLGQNINALTARAYSKLGDSTFYLNAKHNYSDALTELAESVNTDVQRFKRMSRAMILKNKKTFLIVMRILRHNQMFKIALSQSWPQRREWREAFDALEIDSAKNEDSSASNVEDQSGLISNQPKSYEGKTLNPAEVLDIINHLAMSFALTRVVTPRTALHKVYWCYIYLHRCGAPIQAPMTRALWHVGVTRYGPGGTATTLLRWILKQVEMAEGKEAARELIWSSMFRKRRAEAFKILESQILDDIEQGFPEDIPEELNVTEDEIFALEAEDK